MALKVNNDPNNQSIGLNYMRSIPLYVGGDNPQPGANNVQPWRYGFMDNRAQNFSGHAYRDLNIQNPVQLQFNPAGVPLWTIPVNPHIATPWQYFMGGIPQVKPKLKMPANLPIYIRGIGQ